MSTEVHTICFHTRDAVERDDSRLVFNLPQNRLRSHSVKVALGSVEFPMVQWTIEDEWCRLWMNEGIRADVDANTIDISVRGLDGATATGSVGVPLRLNPITATASSASGVEVECGEPHHLWASDGKTCLLRTIQDWGGDVRIVCRRSGDVSLLTAWQDGKLRRVSETRFVIEDVPYVPFDPCASEFVYCSAIPTPHHLCKLLTVSARGAACGGRFTFVYNASLDTVRVTPNLPRGCSACLLPSRLANLLGVGTLEMRMERENDSLPCGPCNMWDYVNIPPGFYSPCHRPMCTGQPMNLGTEVEAALNRFYFHLPASDDSRLQSSPSTPHAIVFVDPCSVTHLCPIPCGRYTPDQVCTHLQTQMTRLCAADISFSVQHDEHDRFVFTCERARSHDGRVEPASFSILFNHPLCTQASRFGFPAQPCIGSSAYTSTHPIHVPRGDLLLSPNARHFSNLLRVEEIPSQKRFSVHSTTPPVMVALVTSAPASHSQGDAQLILRTHVNSLPYAHGYQYGDVVRIMPPGAESVSMLCPANFAKTEWVVEDHPSAKSFSGYVTAVVAGADALDPTVLVLFAPRIADVGSCVQIMSTGPEPFNMCFSDSRPSGIDPYIMGFQRRSIQWGLDGSIDTGVCKIPPFVAPNVHCLDHPDYVLITLDESASANLEHSYNGESRNVFCKLSLYPLFREERMLPRDAEIQRGTFPRFEIAFWNPDMKRPYKFHGAEFSFSLNFISVMP